MRTSGLDLLLVGPSPDFTYLTGHRVVPSERLTLLVLPQEGPGQVFLPALQAPLVGDFRGQWCFHTWADGDAPLVAVSGAIAVSGARVVGVNPELWSGFVLALQRMQPSVNYVDAGPIVSALRQVKDTAELSIMSDAARRMDAVWREFCGTSKLVGRTEAEIARRLREILLSNGFDDVAWSDVGSGPHGASPVHHGCDREVQPGDPVVIDLAATYRGYYADTCRTPVAGDPHPEFVALYEVALQAQEAAFCAIRPGVPCEEPDRAARRVIVEHGHGEGILHRLGHGIGLAAHESPFIVVGNTDELEPGMVFSDEPGIYVPGKWGVRIEDILVVEARGARRLNHAPRELMILS